MSEYDLALKMLKELDYQVAITQKATTAVKLFIDGKEDTVTSSMYSQGSEKSFSVNQNFKGVEPDKIRSDFEKEKQRILTFIGEETRNEEIDYEIKKLKELRLGGRIDDYGYEIGKLALETLRVGNEYESHFDVADRIQFYLSDDLIQKKNIDDVAGAFLNIRNQYKQLFGFNDEGIEVPPRIDANLDYFNFNKFQEAMEEAERTILEEEGLEAILEDNTTDGYKKEHELVSNPEENEINYYPKAS